MNQKIKNELLAEIEKLKTPEGYLMAGYPNYFFLFGRDSLISSWQMLEIDSAIAKNTLEILAKYQGKTVNNKREEEPGKILHEYRFKRKDRLALPRLDFPYYGSVDSTPLFVIVAERYLEQTGDEEFVARIWDNVIMALNWLSAYGDKDNDNFIEYERKNPYGLFHQGWRDNFENHLKINPPVAIVEAQGYAYAAYMAGVKLAENFGRGDFLKNLWAEKAAALAAAFQKRFWWEEERYYYLALDKNKEPKRSVSSNPGHLLFSGIVPERAARKTVKRLFQKDMFTPFGIRTVSENDPDFDCSSYHLGSVWPHDNWMIYYGLKRSGFSKEAELIKRSMLAAYNELRSAPELFGVKDGKIFSLAGGAKQYEKRPRKTIKANPLQAWAACGLLNMIWED